jgi:uncharacterized protein (TIGR01777 family)
MKILITGASGCVGQKLAHALQTSNTLTLVGRDIQRLKRLFPHNVQYLSTQDLLDITAQHLSHQDIVINLAGENIGEKRWTAAQQARIIQSRTSLTSALANACAELPNIQRPRLINASAIGIYGTQATHDLQNTTIYNEHSPLPQPPKDFLASVGKAWEDALLPAITAGASVTKLRFGVILAANCGALSKLLPSFKLGMGAKLGSGEQPFTWVAIDDVIAAIMHIIKDPSLTGPINIVAPEIVTQAELARSLANCLHRPQWLTLPSYVVRLLFGQMSEELLLNGLRVEANRLSSSGFTFKYPTLESALQAILA